MGVTVEELKKHIESDLNVWAIPESHRGAFVIYYDEAGARTVIAVRTSDGWEISGIIGWHSHEKGLQPGINLMKTW